MAEVTCLEKRADVARDQELRRSDYNETNQYSAEHEDAKANGTRLGRGTGLSGETDWMPNCDDAEKGIFKSSFDTDYNSHAGNDVDNETRDKAMLKSKYSPNKPYGDVQLPQREGQYFVP